MKSSQIRLSKLTDSISNFLENSPIIKELKKDHKVSTDTRNFSLIMLMKK
jgi:hypothetical protein